MDSAIKGAPPEIDVTSIPISQIKVNNRLRRTDENRIADLAESI